MNILAAVVFWVVWGLATIGTMVWLVYLWCDFKDQEENRR